MLTQSLLLPTATREKGLALAVASLVVLACLPLDPYRLLPALPPAHMHSFADTRTWLGIPNAFDVLSNLPFAILGLVGLWKLAALDGKALPRPLARCATLLFAGLLLTAAGSAAFHLQPMDRLGLALDRSGMSVAFAGMLGLAACERVSHRAGRALGALALAGALLAVLCWFLWDTVWPWAVVQFGGMALVLVFAYLQPVPGTLGVRLWPVIGAYAVAKGLELSDQAVLGLTAGLVSGHSMKHVAASLAGLVVLQALRHNAPTGALPVQTPVAA